MLDFLKDSDSDIDSSRREFLKTAGATAGSAVLPLQPVNEIESGNSHPELIVEKTPGLNSSWLSLSRRDTDNGEMIVFPTEEIPDNHVFEKLSQPIPEPDLIDTALHESSGEYLKNYSQVWKEIMERSDGPENAWKMLSEDAKTISSTEFEYIDRRLSGNSNFQSKEAELYVEVPEVEDSELPDLLEDGFYFGEYFDAWFCRENEVNSGVYDTGVLLIFEEGYRTEDLLTEKEFRSGNELGEPQEILKAIYEASDREKEEYEFNFAV